MSVAALRRELKLLREKVGEATATSPQVDDPVAWAEQIFGFDLDGWQQGVLRSDAKRLALLCSRQSGKSEAVALLAALIGFMGGAVIVVAPSLRQSSNLFRRMRGHLQKAGARFTRETTTEIALVGGGWATCLPGDRPSMLRGLSLRHAGQAALLIDECAFVKEELWPVASPMLAAAPDARLVVLSTPAGPVGEFHRIWTDEASTFERITVRAADCPRISSEFLEEEKRRLGVLYAQEYECEFIASGASVFSADALAAMFAKDVAPNDALAIDQAFDWGGLLPASTKSQKMWSD
jgi:hypothetical protein